MHFARAEADYDSVNRLLCELSESLDAHLDRDYVAIELTEQLFMNAVRVTKGLPDPEVERLHQALAMQRLASGQLLLRLNNLKLEHRKTARPFNSVLPVRKSLGPKASSWVAQWALLKFRVNRHPKRSISF